MGAEVVSVTQPYTQVVLSQIDYVNEINMTFTVVPGISLNGRDIKGAYVL